MENRKNVVLASLIVSGLLFTVHQAAAYKVDTHAYLTQKALEVFNKVNSDKVIPQELTSFLLDGSRREDDPPRPMNHFYDPVKNRGLSQDFAIDPLPIIGTWQKSKDWAQNNSAQSGLAYSPVIATILSSVDAGKIQKYLPTSDFTWNEAIRYWIQGDKEMALFTLGHILHLIQDTSVPDHTRNDPHPGDSPYENYSARFTTDAPDYTNSFRNSLLVPKILPNLDSYFTEIALYSNNNFYSKDTIGIQSGYQNPQPIDSVQIGNFLYGIKKDESGKDIHLYVQTGASSALITSKAIFSLENNVVLDNYWALLSKKSIKYGSGIIDLFFKEVEKNKNNPEFVEKKKDFLGQVIQTAGNLINSLFKSGASNTSQIVSVPITNTPPATTKSPSIKEVSSSPNKSTASTIKISPSPKISPKNTPSPSPKTSVKPSPTAKITPSPKPSPSPSPIQNTCTIPQEASPSYSPVLINEIAWMGTTQSASNEWIELKNISTNTIHISGWGLKSADGSIDISVPNITISGGGYALFERTDDNAVNDTKADLIYTGSLSNTGERLYLFDHACTVIDALTQTKWPAGNATDRKTMERNEYAKTWYTSSIINGTPKKTNSSQLSSGGGSSSTYIYPTPPSTPEPSVEPSPSPSPIPSPSPSPSPVFKEIKITEIYYNPDGNDEDREWIEIQNTDIEAVHIEDWGFHEDGTMHHLTVVSGNATLQPGEYAVIADNAERFLAEYGAEFSGLLLDSSFSLLNTGELLSLYNKDLLIEEISYIPQWGADENGNSLQKINESWCQGPPTPGIENVCESPPEEELPHRQLSLSYLANIIDTPEEERDMEGFSPAIIASWQGELGGGEWYIIEDISDPKNPILIGTAENDYFRFKISEINKTYVIRASATDGENISTTFQGTIYVPGYLEKIEFNDQNNPTINLSYKQFPFIPDVYQINQGGNGKKLVVFFLNQDPLADGLIHFSAEDSRMTDEWSEGMKQGLTRVNYKKCGGDLYTGPALILKNDHLTCPANQNFIQPDAIGKTSLRVYLEKDRTFSSSDYVTTAYYTQAALNWGGETHYLVATDKTKYFFSE